MKMNGDTLIRSSRKTVLVVEDEAINREMLGFILQEDYDVLYAENGRDALEVLRERAVSMILLDINMPVMNGYELMDKLRADTKLSGIPIIVLTSDKNAEVEALDRGAVDFIPKPYDMPAIILARVKRIIQFAEDRQLIRDIERDELTGLYSRNFFLEYCASLLAERKDRPMDMIAMDIDRFRLINEIYGKGMGDTVLSALAEGLKDLLKEHVGIGCRSDADLFYLFVERMEDYAQTLAAVARRVQAIEGMASVHLRMGVYQGVDGTHPVEWFCDAAKAACSSTRGNYVQNISIYDATFNERELYNQRLISDIDQAIAQKQFKVFYQPKFSIQGEKPVLYSAEALVRWVHPELGFISPGAFIPLFEDNGLISRLDTYVWSEAAAQIRVWREKYGFTLPVSVNLSRQDLFDVNLLDRINRIVRENGIDRQALHLEVTESVYAQDMDQMLLAMSRLRDAGFKIEMDDFGSGYSSLNMLCLMPLDALKIDMKFVQNVLSAPSGYHVLEFVIDLAHSLSLPAIVEGVEEEQQYKLVKRAGCDLVQGYYFSRPVDPAAFELLIVQSLSDGRQMEGDTVLPHAVSYASIARALSQDFYTLYYVNMETDDYVEYGSPGGSQGLVLERSGTDFFEESKRRILLSVHPEDQQTASDAFDKRRLQAVLEENKTYAVTYRQIVNDQPVYFSTKFMRIAGDKNHILIGISNIDAQKRQELAYAHELSNAWALANRDALTGVKNKNAYTNAEQELDRQIARGEKPVFGIAVCDTNELKQINDSQGHSAGDQYLKDACKIICDIFRHSPVFRIGGDEFAVILKGGDYEVRRDLKDRLYQISLENAQEGGITIACGMAEFDPLTDRSVSQVFDQADAAMYENKQVLKRK